MKSRIFNHLEDYRTPLAILPCCGSCHQALHIRFAKPERWWAKVREHGRAGSWLTLITMDPASQMRPFDETYPDGLPEPDWEIFDAKDDSHATGVLKQPSHGSRASLKDRVIDAFKRMPLTEYERRLVRALLDNPAGTPASLTGAIDAKGRSAWQLHFGALCRRREADLGIAPPASNRKTAQGEEALFYTGLLADWDGRAGTFTMKPEATQAFTELGIFQGRTIAS